MDYFQLMRNFWDFAFENPDKIKPNHCAVYCFAVEHCNRLGRKKKFGFPSSMVMDAVGLKCYNSYIKVFNELVAFGFFELIEKSKNQFSSNIIALSNFDKALDKALDKAMLMQSTKQRESTSQSNHSIKELIPNTLELITKSSLKDKNETFISDLLKTQSWVENMCMRNKINVEELGNWLNVFDLKIKTELDEKISKKDFASHFSRWLPGEMQKQNNQKVIELNTVQPTRKLWKGE
ncbi:DUF7833 domain-containing protein [Flavobacterium algicola]|uniref:DUF7833 domain-containing protein n=1 Tax=Flavobacterium algicola TaxID=556529 RepID=UPI001EFC3172|nr:hypothetical protein [Flavobacterium algicola]MCG9792504.1 hypothetical protein [Flavobacterium algicola]